jgi:hypothetical protein
MPKTDNSLAKIEISNLRIPYLFLVEGKYSLGMVWKLAFGLSIGSEVNQKSLFWSDSRLKTNFRPTYGLWSEDKLEASFSGPR